MRGYKNFESDPHPGELRHKIEIGYTENAINENGYPAPTDHSDRSGTLTLPEYVYATYNELMKNGWRMKEIDEMDMLGFLRLRAWDAQREAEKKKPRQRFIDEVWPRVKP